MKRFKNQKNCLTRYKNFENFKLFQKGLLVFKSIIRLQKGLIFGEKGLDDNARRNATILCAEDTDFAIMTKEDYVVILKELSRAKTKKHNMFIHDIVFKSSVNLQLAEKLSYDFFRLKFQAKKNEIIFRQGDLTDFIYIIKRGRILLYREQTIKQKKFDHQLLETRNKKEDLKIVELGQGEFFGDTWLINKQWERFYTAKCLEKCTLLKVSHITILDHMKSEVALEMYLKRQATLKTSQRLHSLQFQLLGKEKDIVDYNYKQMGLDPPGKLAFKRQKAIEDINLKTKEVNLATKIIESKKFEFKMPLNYDKKSDFEIAGLVKKAQTSRFEKLEQNVAETRLIKEYGKNSLIDSEEYIKLNFLAVLNQSRKIKIMERKNPFTIFENLQPRSSPKSHRKQLKLKSEGAGYMSVTSLNPFFNKNSTLYKKNNKKLKTDRHILQDLKSVRSVVSLDRRTKRRKKNKDFKIAKKVPKSVRMLNKMNVLETSAIARPFRTETEPSGGFKKRCLTAAANKPLKRRNSFFKDTQKQ